MAETTRDWVEQMFALCECGHRRAVHLPVYKNDPNSPVRCMACKPLIGCNEYKRVIAPEGDQ